MYETFYGKKRKYTTAIRHGILTDPPPNADGQARMPPIENILPHLDRVRATGPRKWIARCPAHDDKSPSLSIRAADNGTILLRCFAGCCASEIISAIGLELADLFPPRLPASKHFHRSKAPRISWSEMFDAIETDLLTLAIAGRYIAEGNKFSKEDGVEIEKRAKHLATTISEVRSNGRN